MSETFPERFAVSEDVLCQEMGDEMVLLNLATQQYFALDSVGVRMWQLLTEHGDVDTVIRHLASEYDAEENTLRADLMALAGRLQVAGLLQPVG